MKQYQINKAYNVLKKLSHMEFDVKTAYNIFRLIKTLEPACAFQMQHEKKLLEKYGGSINRDGNIVFTSSQYGEDAVAQWENELTSLLEMENDLQYDPIQISLNDFASQKITPQDILSLDGFVVFTGQE